MDDPADQIDRDGSDGRLYERKVPNEHCRWMFWEREAVREGLGREKIWVDLLKESH